VPEAILRQLAYTARECPVKSLPLAPDRACISYARLRELTADLAKQRSENARLLEEHDRKIARLRRQLDELRERTESERAAFNARMREVTV